MSEESRYLVFPAEFDVATFASFVEEFDLEPCRVQRADDAEGFDEFVWTDRDRQVAFHLCANKNWDVNYLWVHGRDIKPWLMAVGARFPLAWVDYTISQLKAATSEHAKEAEVMRLGLMCDVFIRAAHDAIVAAAAQSECESVRIAAVRALGFHGVPEHVPALERIRDTDPSANVRGLAKRALEYLASSTGG